MAIYLDIAMQLSKIVCRQTYLDKNEIFWLLYDTNENEDWDSESGDKFDDNDQVNSQNEEKAVEKDFEDDVDSIYGIDDMNKLDETDIDH